MARFVINDELTQQIISSENVVYRNFARLTADANNVSTAYSLFSITLPFPEVLLKRVTVYKADSEQQIALGNVVICETQQDNPEQATNKVLHYANIDFSTTYLDSLEDIYLIADENTQMHVYIKGDANQSNMKIKIDLEKVN